MFLRSSRLVVQCTLTQKKSVMYSVASKTKTKSKGLKEYQNYVALIHSILKTKNQRCGFH